jgi:hypothetical protein
MAALDEMKAGNHVVYVDFEDDEGGVVGRLLTMGARKDTIRNQFHYHRPSSALGTGIHLDDLNHTLHTHWPITLGVIDGITEAMSLHGLNPLDNKDAATFRHILPARITAVDAAAVNLDHVTKSREGRGRYALGAVHKINALGGASYLLENRHPFGIGITGRSTIKITKDRPGQLRRHGLPSSGGMHWYGDLVIDSDETFTDVAVEPPEHRDEPFRPTHVMAKLWSLIDTNAGDKGLSGRAIQDLAKGNAATNRQALALLHVEGHITQSPHKTLTTFPPPEATTT